MNAKIAAQPLAPYKRVILCERLMSRTPGERARALAAEHGKDPRLVELILSETAQLCAPTTAG